MTDEEFTITSLGDVEPKMQLKGVVKQVQLAGAIIDVGIEECNAVLHISQIRRRRVNNVADFLSEGQKVTVWVRSVDKVNGRLDVTMIKPATLDWDEIKPGQVYTGKVVRIEKFGVFVDIGAERPGLVHISELASGYVTSPEDVVTKNQEVEVKVINVKPDKHQIDLSMKAVAAPPQQVASQAQEEKEEEMPTAMALAMQRALAGTQSKQPEAVRTARRKESQAKKDVQDQILRRTLERHEGES